MSTHPRTRISPRRQRLAAALLTLGLLSAGTAYALSCSAPHEVAELELVELTEDGAPGDTTPYRGYTISLEAGLGQPNIVTLQIVNATGSVNVWEVYNAR